MPMGNDTAKTIPLFLALSGLVLAALVVLTGCNPDELSVKNEPVSTGAPATQPPFSLEGVTTQTPTPFPTATPTATPTPTAIPIPPRAILADEAYTFLRLFLEDHNQRRPGTVGERVASRALRNALDDLGYETRLERYDLGPGGSHASYLANDASVSAQVELSSRALEFSPHGEVTGELVYVQKALEGEVPAEGLEGKVALIERGDALFSDKAKRVAAAGAAAAIIFNNAPGDLRWRFTEGSPIPGVGISQQEGLHLLDVLAREAMEVTVRVTPANSVSMNVIADKPGIRYPSEVIYLTTYVDTGANVDGANDNGSGVASLMTVARHVAERDYPFTVRFAFFGSLHAASEPEYYLEPPAATDSPQDSAPERGAPGSVYHLSQLAEDAPADIKVMVNVFMCGAGETLELHGTPEFRLTMRDEARELRLTVSDKWGVLGDAEHFHARDIDTLTLTGNDYTHHHLATDTIENIDAALLGQSVALTIGFLERLAGR